MTPGSAPLLEAVDFSTPSTGLGVFTEESTSGYKCSDYVGKTTDGGKVFTSLVDAMSWNCTNLYGSLLATDGRGDAFLYGPQFFVSHDNAKTWNRVRESGTVLDVSAVGLSVWIVVSACTHADTISDVPCSVHLLESTNGGRSWEPFPQSPHGHAGGFSYNLADGQSYLVRTSQSSAYLMLPPSFNSHGGPDVAPLWFTSNGGRSWSARRVPCHIGAMSAVLSVSPDGTLMSVCASQPSAGEQIKSVLESANEGRTWVLKTDSNIDFGYLGSIDLVSSREAFLVGDRSSLLVTHDGGAHWQPVRNVTAGGGGGTSLVDFFDAAHGLVLGNDDSDNEQLTLWSTADGGTHWSAKVPQVG
ncbi:MAG: hypothetical protein WCA31_02700 [Acidimicrobiales bacterium]